MPDGSAPLRSAFTPRERRLIESLRTPAQVQRFLNALPYNTEPPPERAKLRSFRGVVRHNTAHCLEAALAAAVILEQHGHPPLVLSFESIDLLDHVLFVYRGPRGWGSVARSRDPGLHGRKPLFATPRALALSYFEGYIDFTGRIKAYAVVDLPRAATKLAQGPGRLIRTATDQGVVAVLDPRLASARYRWEIVNALPPMRRTKDRTEVEAFLRGLAQ